MLDKFRKSLPDLLTILIGKWKNIFNWKTTKILFDKVTVFIQLINKIFIWQANTIFFWWISNFFDDLKKV